MFGFRGNVSIARAALGRHTGLSAPRGPMQSCTADGVRTLATTVRLSIWCDSQEAVLAGRKLFAHHASGSAETESAHESTHGFSRVRVDEKTVVDFVALPTVSRKRRMLFRKHGGARMVKVSVVEDDEAMPEPGEVVENLSKLVLGSNLIYHDSPTFLPELEVKSPTKQIDKPDEENASENVFVREIVVGVGEEEARLEAVLDTLDSTMTNVAPFLYHISGHTYIRVLPSMHSTLVFSVPDLDTARGESERLGTFLGRVGATGMSAGQFHVTSENPALLRGLDIRMCGNRGAPSLMFAESNESTFAGSIHMSTPHGEVSCRGRTAREGLHRVMHLWSTLGRA